MDEEPPEIHLTQDDYDRSKDMTLESEHEKFGVSATQYQDTLENLLGEVQWKYNLRARPRKIPKTPTNSMRKTPAREK